MPETTTSRRPFRAAHPVGRRRWLAAALVLATLGWGAPVAAQTAACTGVISSIPYVITGSGVYCLGQNLASAAAGHAIVVDANFVVIDLNGFMLNGLSAGPASTAAGIYALNRKNITIRNGTIRGFFTGILLNDTSADKSSSAGHLVHDVLAVNNSWVGIYVTGRGNVVRDNIVRNTGGTTYYGPNADTAGIITLGAGARVIGNDIIDTIGVGTGVGRAIRLAETAGTVVEGNRITSSTPSTPAVGVSIEYATSDVLVLGNRIGVMSIGVEFMSGATGKYGHNVTVGTAQPYVGGTDLGNNN